MIRPTPLNPWCSGTARKRKPRRDFPAGPPGILLIALLLLPGCGTGGDPEFVRHDPCPRDTLDRCDCPGEAVDDTGAVTPDTVDTALPDVEHPGPFSGTFAVEGVVKAQVLGVTLESRQYYLLQLVQDNLTVHQRSALCVLQLPSVSGIAELIIPDAVQQLIHSKVAVDAGEYVSAAEPPATYDPPPQIVLVGVAVPEGADPWTIALPTKDSPEGALDEDGDGNPGITLDVDTVTCEAIEQIYIALKTTADIEATFEDANRLEGEFVADLSQTVLGWSHDCLELAAGLTIVVQPPSLIHGVRIDGRNGTANLDANGDGTITCDELAAGIEQVFPGE